MKLKSALLTIPAAACLFLMTAPRSWAGPEIKYPAGSPTVTLSAPDDWKSAATKDGSTLTLTPATAGGVYKIVFLGLPAGTSGELSDVCAKRAEAAMKESGVQPVNVHPPEKDKTEKGTQLAVSYCIYKEGGQERRCFLTVISPASGKYYQATVYFNSDSDEGTAQRTLIALLDSIKPL